MYSKIHLYSVPKISDQRRAERRLSILNSARTCFLRQGLHATTMETIIRESGLSAGAVYGYFPSKEKLIFEAVTSSLNGLQALFRPVFARDPLPPPSALLEEIARLMAAYSVEQGFDLHRVALLGWSEAQSNPALHNVMRLSYGGFLDLLTQASRTWQQQGQISASVDPKETAASLLSCLMGYVAQSALLGPLPPEALGRGFSALSTNTNSSK